MKLRIGHLSTFYHTAIILMARGDAAARLGVDVEWKLMGTGPAIMSAFRNGEIDLAYIGLPPAIIGIEQGIRVVCVAGGHMEGTVIAAKSRWKGHPEAGGLGNVLGQFRDCKIGVPGKGSIHDVILKECLRRYGLEERIEVVNFPWADLVTEAVVHDEVAAAIGTPSLAVAIRRFAGGKVLYPPSKLWPRNPSYGIVVDTGYLGKAREIVEQFLILHEEATSYIRKRPREAAETISDYVGIIDAPFVMETLELSPRYCAQLTEGYLSATMEFVKALARLDYIRRDVSEEEIFDTSLIKKIHPEKDHYDDGLHEAT